MRVQQDLVAVVGGPGPGIKGHGTLHALVDQSSFIVGLGLLSSPQRLPVGAHTTSCTANVRRRAI